jgi:hypothetical protein
MIEIPFLNEKAYMTGVERQLFIGDLKNVCCRYFEDGDKFSLDITPMEDGFCVCIVFDARRIKSCKRPL